MANIEVNWKENALQAVIRQKERDDQYERQKKIWYDDSWRNMLIALGIRFKDPTLLTTRNLCIDGITFHRKDKGSEDIHVSLVRYCPKCKETRFAETFSFTGKEFPQKDWYISKLGNWLMNPYCPSHDGQTVECSFDYQGDEEEVTYIVDGMVTTKEGAKNTLSSRIAQLNGGEPTTYIGAPILTEVVENSGPKTKSLGELVMGLFGRKEVV